MVRWMEPVPASSPDPVKVVPGAGGVGVRVERKKTPTLFDDVADTARGGGKGKEKEKGGEEDDEDIGMIDLDDWMVDDAGIGAEEDEEGKRWNGESGVREMGE